MRKSTAKTADRDDAALIMEERRGKALSVLHRTATDIIAVVGVDEVLEAAVERAQKLLASELAYLSIFDQSSGEMYVRASVGARSASFAKIRVPVGAGLAGAVAQQRSSYATRDYLTDKRLRHMSRTDKDIAAEGIRAMLGVPLSVRGRFTGALFAADRHPRDYTDEEIEHLEALGALVAVALENARLLEEREKAFVEMKAAYEALRTRSLASERLAATHEKIKEALQDRSLQGLLDALARDLDCDLAYVGTGLKPIAVSARHGVNPLALPAAAIRAAIEASERSASGQAAGLLGPAEVWVFASAVTGLPAGALLAAASRPVLGSDQRTLEEATYAATLILASEREAERERGRARSELMLKLLEGRPGASSVAAAADDLGVDLDSPAALLAFAVPDVAEDLRERIAEIAEERDGLCGEHRDALFLLLPGASKEAVRSLREELSAALAEPVAIGWSPVAEPRSGIQAAARDALSCLRVLQSLGLHQAAELADLGLHALLLRGNEETDIAEFLRRSLGAVLDYDLRHGTALADTLAAFFATGQNASQAAQQLSIHQKTMVQRLDRLTQLLGPDWRLGEQSLSIQLALHIRSLGLAGEAGRPVSQEKSK